MRHDHGVTACRSILAMITPVLSVGRVGPGKYKSQAAAKLRNGAEALASHLWGCGSLEGHKRSWNGSGSFVLPASGHSCANS